MFLRPDDYIIAMESTAACRQYTLADMERMRDAGIGLISKQVDWREIETAPGVYDWGRVDQQVANARRAGMRYLLLTPGQEPPHFPVDWYAKSKDGILNGPAVTDEMIFRGQSHSPSQLSMWHDEAMAVEDDFLRAFTARYRSPGVLFAHAVGGGEGFLPGGARAFMDRAALDDFEVKHGCPLRIYNAQEAMHTRYLDAQTGQIVAWLNARCLKTFCQKHAILAKANPSREIYVGLHEMLQDFAGAWDSGVLLDPLYAGIREAFGDPPIISIHFTHHIHGLVWTVRFMQRMKRRGVHVFGGAEYCVGLAKHAPVSAEDGSRLILGVKGDLSPNDEIEPWMLDAIRDARAVLAQSEACAWKELWEDADSDGSL